MIWIPMFLVLVLALIGWVLVYNHLTVLRNNSRKALANIDVVLKQRHDELPKLIAVCERYAQFESALLTEITVAREMVERARQKSIPSERAEQMAQAEQRLQQGLTTLFARAEAYPDLKANQEFMHLQRRITDLENEIADRRETYNEAVMMLTSAADTIPGRWVASSVPQATGHFVMLKFSEADLSDVDVKALMSPAKPSEATAA